MDGKKEGEEGEGKRGKGKTLLLHSTQRRIPQWKFQTPLFSEQVTPRDIHYRVSVTVFVPPLVVLFGWFVLFPPTYNPNRGRQLAWRRLRSARRRMQGTLLARLANGNTEEVTLKTLSLYYCIDRTTRRRRMTGAAVCGVRGDKMEVKKCYFVGEEKLVLRTSNTNRRGS